jgi:hypothetical protein
MDCLQQPQAIDPTADGLQIISPHRAHNGRLQAGFGARKAWCCSGKDGARRRWGKSVHPRKTPPQKPEAFS